MAPAVPEALVVRVAPVPARVVRAVAEPEVRAHAAAPAQQGTPRMQATMVLLAVPAAPVEQMGRQPKVAPAVPAMTVVRVESVEPAEPAPCPKPQGSPVSEVSAAYAVSQGPAAPGALMASRKTIPRPRAL